MDTSQSDPIVQGVRITHPDKVLFEDPAITKADVARYYEKVADHMLPHVRNRILSIVRCPRGLSQPCFYKRHPGRGDKGIVKVSDGKGDYFYIEDATGLIAEVQMGTLEFHPWGSRVGTMENPDIMVFDLDPDVGMDLGQIRQGVKHLQSVLEERSLVTFLKTSGGKGYHVVIPFKPVDSWDAFHAYAKSIALAMEQRWSDRYTSHSSKAGRKGKIFVDWLRNARGATSVAPYSIRARKGANVSIPIAWSELDTVAPNGVNMSNALQRIGNQDPWKDFFQVDQQMK